MESVGEFIDLRQHPGLVEQYVAMRNANVELLLTEPIGIQQTLSYFKSEPNVEVRGIVRDGVLLGCVILYLTRAGEIAVMASGHMRGTGTQLLTRIDEVALARGLSSTWAWVRADNPRALRLFQKCGYRSVGPETRSYRGQVLPGTRLEKNLASLSPPSGGSLDLA